MDVSVKYQARVTMPWLAQAACHGKEYLFFEVDGTGTTQPRTATDVERIKQAKAVCYGCPVRAECLRHAVRYPEPWGVWGGLTAQQRSLLRTNAKKKQEARRQQRRETRGGRHGSAREAPVGRDHSTGGGTAARAGIS